MFSFYALEDAVLNVSTAIHHMERTIERVGSVPPVVLRLAYEIGRKCEEMETMVKEMEGDA